MDPTRPDRLDALLRKAAARLPGSEGRHESEILLAHALGRDRAWLFAHATDAVPPDVRDGFERLIERRVAGEPVAYLTGHRGFWTLDLTVTPDTLIPRPETERLVELVLDRLVADEPSRVADLGTGSGAIALAVASERPLAKVIATDASVAALEVARANAVRNALGNVEFRAGNWWEPLAGERFDLVASNPPYIAGGDPHLAQGDLRFEPAPALSSGADGLDAIREIIMGASAHLHADGWLLMEHGLAQGDEIRALLRDAGFADAATEIDLEGRDRITLGRWPGG